MCSSISVGKITKAYCSTCVAVADFVLDTPFFTEVLPVECSLVDWGLAASSGALLQALPLLYRTRFLLASEQRRQEERGTFCQRNKEKKGNIYLHLKNGVEMLYHWWVIKFCIISPPPLSPRPNQFHIRIPRPHPGIVFSPRVNSADSRRGGVGGGLGSPLQGFSPNAEIRFFDEFSIFTWLLPCFLADIFPSWNWGFFDVIHAFRWWLLSAV